MDLEKVDLFFLIRVDEARCSVDNALEFNPEFGCTVVGPPCSFQSTNGATADL